MCRIGNYLNCVELSLDSNGKADAVLISANGKLSMFTTHGSAVENSTIKDAMAVAMDVANGSVLDNFEVTVTFKATTDDLLLTVNEYLHSIPDIYFASSTSEENLLAGGIQLEGENFKKCIAHLPEFILNDHDDELAQKIVAHEVSEFTGQEDFDMKEYYRVSPLIKEVFHYTVGVKSGYLPAMVKLYKKYSENIDNGLDAVLKSLHCMTNPLFINSVPDENNTSFQHIMSTKPDDKDGGIELACGDNSYEHFVSSFSTLYMAGFLDVKKAFECNCGK